MGTPTTVDAYSHILPKTFYKEVRSAYLNGESELSGPRQPYDDADQLWDVDKRLDDLDDVGIDKQVLTLAHPPIWRSVDSTQVRPLIELANDEVSRIAREHGDRFVPVGTIPEPTSEFLDEVERCIDELQMAGIQIFSNVRGQPLDSPEFHEFFELINRREIPLWMHPQLHDWYPWIHEGMAGKLFGWPFDTSVGLSRLIFGGVFEEFPNLTVIAHHNGGMLPFFGETLETKYNARRQYPEMFPELDLSDLSRSLDTYLDQIVGDTAVSGSVSALQCGLDFYGGENMVFGADYPYGPDGGRMWLERTVDAVDDLDASSSTKAKITNENISNIIS